VSSRVLLHVVKLKVHPQLLLSIRSQLVAQLNLSEIRSRDECLLHNACVSQWLRENQRIPMDVSQNFVDGLWVELNRQTGNVRVDARKSVAGHVEEGGTGALVDDVVVSISKVDEHVEKNRWRLVGVRVLEGQRGFSSE